MSNTGRKSTGASKLKIPKAAEVDNQVDEQIEEEVKEVSVSAESQPTGKSEEPVSSAAEETFKAPPSQIRQKEFQPVKNAEGLWVIKLTGGGKVPDKLSGAYTAITEAEYAIKKYTRG